MLRELHESEQTWGRIIRADAELTRSHLPLKFWEVAIFFKCPLVGACLTLGEQKQLLKKSGYNAKNKSPFEIHEILVASGRDENRLSRRVDNLLSRKFKKQAAGLLELDKERFMARFYAAFKEGNYLDVLWAAAVNPRLPYDSRQEIFGEIHMAMHFSGEQVMKQKRRAKTAENALADLRSRLKQAGQARRELQKQNQALAKANQELAARISLIENENARLGAGTRNDAPRNKDAGMEQQTAVLQKSLDAMTEKSAAQNRQLSLTEQENLRLSTELARQEKLTQRFQKETGEILEEIFSMNSCSAACPSFDLCKKRILMVGGITKMESLYRELIEKGGGIFEYHDGYMKKGVKPLESRLKRADMVICPVNCNSHAACSIVKNLAKKHNKSVHMLASSSLSSVSRAIWGKGEEKGILN